MKAAAIAIGVILGLRGIDHARSVHADVVRPIPSVELAECIDRWCDSTGVPRRIAYGVALAETGYRGAAHFSYEPRQTSYAGAVGPMQVMPKTASWVTGVPLHKCEAMLMDSIDFNVMCSLRYLAGLHKRRKSWAVALGEYNTGYPVVNGYATKIMSR